MFETLKIIHMLSLFGGGAAGIGNGILMAKVMRAEGPPPDIVKATMKNLGMTGLASVVLLWLTGIGMVSVLGIGISWEFAAKLVAAALLLGSVVTLSVLAARAESAGTPPPLPKMKAISRFAMAAAVVAVIFAVIAFN